MLGLCQWSFEIRKHASAPTMEVVLVVTKNLTNQIV